MMSSEQKVALKMVNGERYGCPAVGDDIILKGQTIRVSVELANVLLADSYFDASNNEHFYFEQVDEDAEDDETPSSSSDALAPGEDRTGEGSTDTTTAKAVVQPAAPAKKAAPRTARVKPSK